MKNIFVVGLEPFNRALLEGLRDANSYRFIRLLSYEEAVRPPNRDFDLRQLLETAETRLRDFSGSIDAIIGYWDFPSSVLVPILRHRHGLPAPSLEAVATCEHKYWFRTEQQKATPEIASRFCSVDPFVEDPLSTIDLPFPFWIKPIKAHSSYLGFKIRDAADFSAHLPAIRANIGHFGRPFDVFLGMINLPAHISGIGGHHCIAEEMISAGKQCTLEGYVDGDEVVVYGVVDSIRSGKHRSSFARYQYPSQIPHPVQDRMIDAAQRFLRHIGYSQAPFNMEFYWNPRADTIRMLEVNTRISKSHSPLFKMVDGESHQKVAIDLALGRHPDFPHRAGSHSVAAKFMLRVFEDGIVTQVPEAADVERLQRRFPDATVRLMAEEGKQLAHLSYQDSYSFEIAEIFLGAETQKHLLEKYQAALDLLPFRIEAARPEAA